MSEVPLLKLHLNSKHISSHIFFFSENRDLHEKLTKTMTLIERPRHEMAEDAAILKTRVMKTLNHGRKNVTINILSLITQAAIYSYNINKTPI